MRKMIIMIMMQKKDVEKKQKKGWINKKTKNQNLKKN